MDFIRNHLVLVLVALGSVFLAVIGFIAEKKGYVGNKKSEDDLIDFDELSKPKETTAEPVQVEAKEEDLSHSFDEMPDFNNLPEAQEVKTEESDISEDLYAPFGDQVIEKEEKKVEDIKPISKGEVGEVVSDDFKQSFVDVAKIEKESKDIKNEDDKKGVMDLMQDQSDMNFDFVVEGAEETKKEDAPAFEAVIDTEKDKKEKEEEELKNMWNY